jgi:hypothetical protein
MAPHHLISDTRFSAGRYLASSKMIWTILGISVAIVAVFCVTVAESLVGTPLFEQHRPHAALALALSGAIAWFIGRALASRSENARRFLLCDLRYWGPMLLALGVITLFIRPLRHIEHSTPLQAAKPAPRPVVVAKVEPPAAPQPAPAKPAVFPKMKMQGIIYREACPFVIINGASYTVGDQCGDVLVRAIDRESVMLEMAGEVKVLTLN